jgi:hypothetical protein
MASIYYAVISLTMDEVEGVAQKLKDKGMDTVADWLSNNKATLYDDERDGWKPFMDKSIRDLLKTTPDIYESATNLIDQIDDNASDITVLQQLNIEVYFIDIIALYNDKFMKIANKLDYALSTNGKCCLVMPYKLSDELHTVHDGLIANCREMWNAVFNQYKNGLPHRVIMIPADLDNYRECLLAYVDTDAPSLASYREASNVLGSPTITRVPR